MIPKRYISLINVSLLTLLVALAAYLVWDNYRNWYSPEEKTHLQPRESSARPVSTPLPSQYEPIVSRDLWKEKFAAPVDLPPSTPKPPPVPPPKLRLIGTSINIDSSRSIAIIEDIKNRSQRIYHVDDVIAGARILDISRTSVSLTIGGERFVIGSFEKQLPVPKFKSRTALAFQKIGKNKWRISRLGLWKLINRKVMEGLIKNHSFKIALEDVTSSLAKVGCRPYYPPRHRRRGPSDGYEVVILPDDHLAAQLGIKEGDIILSVNGEEITGKKQAVELLGKMQNKDKAVVEINRGGEEVKLTYLIQEEELKIEE